MSRRVRVVAAVLAVGLQLVVLYVPRAPVTGSGGFPLDKVAHVAVFALPTVALLAAGVPRAWVIGLMALHAPLSELFQHFLLEDRSGDGGDMLADLVGVALGASLVRPSGRTDSTPTPSGSELTA